MEKSLLDEVHIDELLSRAMDENWAELHFETGRPPFGRARGSLRMEELSQYEALRPQVVRRLLTDILTNDQIVLLDEHGELNFVYTTADKQTRFGVCMIEHEGNIEAIFCLVSGKK